MADDGFCLLEFERQIAVSISVADNFTIGVYATSMAGSGRDYSWLPEYQFHAAYTLGHVDGLIARVGEILFDYLSPPGPCELENIADDHLAHVMVVSVAPLPPAVARYVADALTQLRATIEHTIYAEVEHQLGRRLTEEEAKRVAMPACTGEKEFAKWLKDRRRDVLPPLCDGTPLVGRLRDLQPYQRSDVDNHPLRVLVEHTNLAKHRTPAVAAMHLGMVKPDSYEPDLIVATGGDRPVEPGDILASSPRYKHVPLSIWPKVSIQRPHTRTWHVVMTELGDLEDWVRRVAVPHLVTGTHDVSALPPQLDTTIGYDDVRVALPLAGEVPAVRRSMRRILAGTVRQDLAEILARLSDRVSSDVIRTWLDTLDDDLVLEKQERLSSRATADDLVGLDATLRELLAEALRASGIGSQ